MKRIYIRFSILRKCAAVHCSIGSFKVRSRRLSTEVRCQRAEDPRALSYFGDFWSYVSFSHPHSHVRITQAIALLNHLLFSPFNNFYLCIPAYVRKSVNCLSPHINRTLICPSITIAGFLSPNLHKKVVQPPQQPPNHPQDLPLKPPLCPPTQ